MPIILIEATPGPKTNERILELLEANPQGMTIGELSDRLNRPVSMLNHCLKFLIAAKRVQGKLNHNQKQWIYYPALSYRFCADKN